MRIRSLYHALGISLAASFTLAAQAPAPALPLGKIPPGKTFLVVLSHHDDHTWEWGFGGFIARLTQAGWTGRFVRTTNDEKDVRLGWGRNDQVNLSEAIEATKALGIGEVISLNWRNDHMDSIPLNELRAHFILLLRRYRPDIVMSWNPWGHYDRNPDHRKVARAIGEAVWMAGLSNVHPEHLDAKLTPHRVPYVYYTQRSDYGLGHEPNTAIEITRAQVDRKTTAFWAHKNVRGEGNPESRRNMELTSREAGRVAGVEFAELFYFIDEFDSLPGLKSYLEKNVVTK
jgi:LmbE family N-acetylglucosaminyl deacetylase